MGGLASASTHLSRAKSVGLILALAFDETFITIGDCFYLEHNDIGCGSHIAMRVLPHLCHILDKLLKAVDHNGWPFFRLDTPFRANKVGLRFLGICQNFHQPLIAPRA